MAKESASIRYKNPGAMWGGNAISKKWGEMGNVSLNDGTGQGNTIAVFPTYEAGICAQIDLWRSPRYKNKTFADAIRVWSGGNSVEQYIKFVTSRVPGMTRDTVMDDKFWKSPMAIAFLKAQAWHEAGKQYPAPEEDWVNAQRKIMGGSTPVATPVIVVAAGAAAGTSMATDTHWAWVTHHWIELAIAAVVLGIVIDVAVELYRKNKNG